MALTLENTGYSDQLASSSTTTITLTITSADLLVCGCNYTDGGQQLSSVVWDAAGANEALTQLIREREASFTGYVSELWYLKAPTAGTSKLITFTLTGALSSWGASAAGFTGADQTTTFGTAVSADSQAGASDPVTVTVSTASGEIVIDHMRADTATSEGANQTVHTVSSIDRWGASTQAGADGGVMSWTKDGGGTQHWVITAVSIKPTGAATTRRYRLPLMGVS